MIFLQADKRSNVLQVRLIALLMGLCPSDCVFGCYGVTVWFSRTRCHKPQAAAPTTSPSVAGKASSMINGPPY